MKPINIAFAILFSVAPAGWAGAFTWDDSSADHEFDNPLNWTADSGYPQAADDAVFTNTLLGPVYLRNTPAIRYLSFNQLSGTMGLELLDGAQFAVTNLSVANGDFSNAVTYVTMTGGTFKVNGDIAIGNHAGNWVSTTYGGMSVSNTVIDLSRASTIRIGGNASISSGSVTGLWDLASATLTADGTNNLFKAGLLAIGGYGAGTGILKLPPTVEEINIASAYFGSAVQASRSLDWSLLDLGDDPQLKRAVFRSYVRFAKMRTVYVENGTSVTGRWPANIEFVLGASNAPIGLLLGEVSQTDAEIAWKEMKSFEAYLTELVLGYNGGSSSGYAYGELDLTATNTTALVGSITSNQVTLPAGLNIGAGTRMGCGVLRLPATVTNIAVGDFKVGAYYNDNPADRISILNFGNNPQVTILEATNDFVLGHGQFIHAVGGLTKTGLPAGITIRIGRSPSIRGTFQYAHMQKAYTVDVGPDIGRFSAYLKQFRVGNLAGGVGSRIVIGRLDLRKAVLDPLDVDGDFIIAIYGNNRGYVYLPPGEVTVSSNLLMGLAFPTAYPLTAYLSLSNTAFHVGGSVRLGTNTTVRSEVAGVSGGLDFEVGTNTVFECNNAKMEVAFLADPLNISRPYWGLKLRNTNAVALVQAWTTSPARVTFSLTGLSVKMREQFGVHYNPMGNYTYLGVPGKPAGTVITVW
jgi:hypothetical protein